MAFAYFVVKNNHLVAITKNGRTNPEIIHNLPHGHPAGDSGTINKSPGAVSPVTGR